MIKSIGDDSLQGWSSYKSFEVKGISFVLKYFVIVLISSSGDTIILDASYAWWKEIQDIAHSEKSTKDKGFGLLMILSLMSKVSQNVLDIKSWWLSNYVLKVFKS